MGLDGMGWEDEKEEKEKMWSRRRSHCLGPELSSAHGRDGRIKNDPYKNDDFPLD